MKLVLLVLLTFSMLYPSFVSADDKDSVFTRTDDYYSAYRVMIASGDNPSEFGKDSVYTRDDNGYLGTRQIIGAGGTIIPTSTDLLIRSLVVGCDSMIPTSGTINALIYSSCGDSAVVTQLTTGSLAGNIEEWNDEGAVTQAAMSKIGNLGLGKDPSGTYKLVLQGGFPLSAYDSTGTAVFEMGANSRFFRLLNGMELEGHNQDVILTVSNDVYDLLSARDAGGTERASINSTGKGTFDGGVESNNDIHITNISNAFIGNKICSYSDDLSIFARPSFGINLFRDFDDSDIHLAISKNEASPTDVDMSLTFTGGTNSGSIALDDGANRFAIDTAIAVSGDISNSGTITAGNYHRSTNGYYGNLVTDEAVFPIGAEYAPISAAPSTPTTGFILYSDSESNSAAKLIFPDGHIHVIYTPVP